VKEQIPISLLFSLLHSDIKIQTLENTRKEHFSNHTSYFYNKVKSHKPMRSHSTHLIFRKKMLINTLTIITHHYIYIEAAVDSNTPPSPQSSHTLK